MGCAAPDVTKSDVVSERELQNMSSVLTFVPMIVKNYWASSWPKLCSEAEWSSVVVSVM